MFEKQNKTDTQFITIVRERFQDQYVFYRLDDVDRKQPLGIQETIMFEFAKKYSALGGLTFFYSEVVAKGMTTDQEYVKDIRTHDGNILWTNSSQVS